MSKTNNFSIEEIEKRAKEELEKEHFEERVKEFKNKLKKKNQLPWYKKLFPFRLKIERIDK